MPADVVLEATLLSQPGRRKWSAAVEHVVLGDCGPPCFSGNVEKALADAVRSVRRERILFVDGLSRGVVE